MTGVDEEVLVGRTVQQPTAGAYRPDGVVIPRSTPPGMAQLQLIVEQVADAEQPLATAFQQDRGMPWGVTGGVDDADAGQDLGVMVERVQPIAKEPDRLPRRRQVLTSSAAGGLRARPEGHLVAWAKPVARGNISSPDQVAPRQWS